MLCNTIYIKIVTTGINFISNFLYMCLAAGLHPHLLGASSDLFGGLDGGVKRRGSYCRESEVKWKGKVNALHYEVLCMLLLCLCFMLTPEDKNCRGLA